MNVQIWIAVSGEVKISSWWLTVLIEAVNHNDQF